MLTNKNLVVIHILTNKFTEKLNRVNLIYKSAKIKQIEISF